MHRYGCMQQLRPMPSQITLRNLFLSKFWWAVWCGALAAYFKSQGLDALIICAIAYKFAGPFIAIGALFGRMWVGALVGLAVVACVAAAAYILCRRLLFDVC